MADQGAGDSWVDGFELCLLSEDHAKFKWASKYMSDTVVDHCGKKIGGYEILEVYVVKNSDLWEKYTDRRRELCEELGERVKEKHLFHGTNQAMDIVENGFKMNLAKNTGMFGKAIYFSDLSSKSSQYTFEGFKTKCIPHRDVFCEECIRTMLLCRVALGKEHHTVVAMNGISGPPAGHHCVIGDPGHDLRYREYAVYHNYQAYPGHLIKYRIKN